MSPTLAGRNSLPPAPPGKPSESQDSCAGKGYISGLSREHRALWKSCSSVPRFENGHVSILGECKWSLLAFMGLLVCLKCFVFSRSSLLIFRCHFPCTVIIQWKESDYHKWCQCCHVLREKKMIQVLFRTRSVLWSYIVLLCMYRTDVVKLRGPAQGLLKSLIHFWARVAF